MAMSQCTTFLLKGGKEEIKVHWDLANKELTIERYKLPGTKEKEQECDSKNCPHKKYAKKSFSFRAKDLDIKETIELGQIIHKAFIMLLGEEEGQYMYNDPNDIHHCSGDDETEFDD